MATNPASKPLMVKPKSNLPFAGPSQSANNMAPKPPVQAANVVLAAIRPMPSASIADSVLPGLKPYHPNHNKNAPTVATTKLCGAGMPPFTASSLLNRRPNLGPNTIAPAKETTPPMVCTTVEPAKSRKPVPSVGRKLPDVPIVAKNPSGPQAQWPIIG